MTKSSKARTYGSLALLLLPLCGLGHAEESVQTPETVVQTEGKVRDSNTSSSFDIGAATDAIFALQRDAPAVRPRTIDGAQASRSYERYLKSFEHPIPEKFDMGTESP